ncbi:MAG: hypothetical protein CL878_14805 [Dehalococcoidia bacterium]|nr:hypothetical protein [Dehalococcoidia bacterium]
MNATERVMAALSFRRPETVPLFDSYWPEFIAAWRRSKQVTGDGAALDEPDAADALDAYYGVDFRLAAAVEAPWPSQVAELSRNGDVVTQRDAWGRVTRKRADAKFFEEVELPVQDRSAVATLEFEPPSLDSRYESFLQRIAVLRSRPNPPCIFAKVGGPYLRTSNLRGIEQWLIDIAEDAGFVAELAGRVTDHIIEVGLESLRRGNLYDTGILIADDIAYNPGVIVGPASYERIFLPLMHKMIHAFKAAGARKVLMHSDGNIGTVLDGLVEAGLDGIHPVEPRAGMDALALRAQYGSRLALIGGVDNAHVLPRGTDEEVRQHVLPRLEAGRDGGLVIGSHSIGPDISVARYDYFVSLVREYG